MPVKVPGSESNLGQLLQAIQINAAQSRGNDSSRLLAALSSQFNERRSQDEALEARERIANRELNQRQQFAQQELAANREATIAQLGARLLETGYEPDEINSLISQLYGGGGGLGSLNIGTGGVGATLNLGRLLSAPTVNNRPTLQDIFSNESAPNMSAIAGLRPRDQERAARLLESQARIEESRESIAGRKQEREQSAKLFPLKEREINLQFDKISEEIAQNKDLHPLRKEAVLTEINSNKARIKEAEETLKLREKEAGLNQQKFQLDRLATAAQTAQTLASTWNIYQGIQLDKERLNIEREKLDLTKEEIYGFLNPDITDKIEKRDIQGLLKTLPIHQFSKATDIIRSLDSVDPARGASDRLLNSLTDIVTTYAADPRSVSAEDALKAAKTLREQGIKFTPQMSNVIAEAERKMRFKFEDELSEFAPSSFNYKKNVSNKDFVETINQAQRLMDLADLSGLPEHKNRIQNRILPDLLRKIDPAGIAKGETSRLYEGRRESYVEALRSVQSIIPKENLVPIPIIEKISNQKLYKIKSYEYGTHEEAEELNRRLLTGDF